MKKFSQLAVPYIVWAALMLVLPMLLIAMYSVTEQGNSIVSFKFTLDHYVRFFTDPDFLIILWRSIWIAVKTTIICLLLGYPIAFFIARSSERVQNILVLGITIPMWINMLVRTYAWIGLLSEGGLISRILGVFGLGHTELLYTQGAVLLGMVYNFLPFMVLPIYNVLAKIDKDVIYAARDLGANEFQTYTQIIFPLSIPGIISGITMVFVPALTTFVISDLLGGSKILLIGNVIEQEFKQGSNWHTGSGLSLVLMIFIIASMAVIAKYDKNGEGTAF